jgi:hypothetical protein
LANTLADAVAHASAVRDSDSGSAVTDHRYVAVSMDDAEYMLDRLPRLPLRF